MFSIPKSKISQKIFFDESQGNFLKGLSSFERAQRTSAVTEETVVVVCSELFNREFNLVTYFGISLERSGILSNSG